MTNKSYLAFLDDSQAADMLSRTKVPGLSALPSLIPHRMRRKWRATKSRIRSRQSVTSSIAGLETSLSPSDTIKALRTHPWSIYDAQYLFLAIVAIFSLSVSEAPGPFAKTFVAGLLMTGLCLPITRQFLLPLLPTLTWFLLFSSCKYVTLCVASAPHLAWLLVLHFGTSGSHDIPSFTAVLRRNADSEPLDTFPATTDPPSGSAFYPPSRTFYMAQT
jgi:hypothetical protein